MNLGDTRQTVCDVKCGLLPMSESEEKPHHQFCEIVALGIILREEVESMFKSVPDISDINARDVVTFMLGSNCQEFALNSVCPESCSGGHSAALHMHPPWCDSKLSFKIFTKWFLGYSVKPNFKMMLQLLSSLNQECDDVTLLILSFSQLLFKLRQDLRSPASLSLTQKLIKLAGVTKSQAIRLIIVFVVERGSSHSLITQLLLNLGVFEPEMDQFYISISCIWHIESNYDFPKNVIFSFLRECIQNVPCDIGLTKDLIIIEVLKIPRKEVVKEFAAVDKFLQSFFPVNSLIAHQVTQIILHRKSPRSVSQTSNSYKSSNVRHCGPVNYKWKYWDVKEAQRNAFSLVLSRSQSLANKKETLTKDNALDTLELERLVDSESSSEEMMAQLLNESLLIDTPSSDLELAAATIESAFEREEYADIAGILQANCKVADECLMLLSNLLLTLDSNSLPNVIHDILTSKTLRGSLRDSFMMTINNLTLNFYQKRDYISAIKLLKTLRICGVNPLEYPPSELNKELFFIICSDIHYETRCYQESVQILSYGNCFKLLMDDSTEDFDHLERVVTKLLKGFLSANMSLYAVNVFRSTVVSQKDLFEPIEIARFYEAVLCSTFTTESKAPCNHHDGANLYIMVDKLCGNIVKFQRITYRGLLCSLVDAEASEDVVRRLLHVCFKTKVYLPFCLQEIALGSNLSFQEMRLYVQHYFQYFVAQDEGKSLVLSPLSVLIFQDSRSCSTTLPVSKTIESVKDDVNEGVERFKLAVKAVAGEVDVPMQFSPHGSGIITVPGIMALLNVIS